LEKIQQQKLKFQLAHNPLCRKFAVAAFCRKVATSCPEYIFSPRCRSIVWPS